MAFRRRLSRWNKVHCVPARHSPRPQGWVYAVATHRVGLPACQVAGSTTTLAGRPLGVDSGQQESLADASFALLVSTGVFGRRETVGLAGMPWPRLQRHIRTHSLQGSTTGPPLARSKTCRDSAV
jgi:hypothetical protein